MIITQVVVDAHDRRAVVGLPVRRNRRHGKRNAVGANEITKARGGVRLHAQALQRERISPGNRLQWIEPASNLKGAEVKQLVVDDRAADPTAELVLCVPLAEGRRSRLIGRPLEVRIAQRIAEGAGEGVRAAPRRRRDLTPRELAARDVVCVRDHPRLAHCLRRYVRAAEEAQPIERHLILIRSLARDGERRRRRIGAGDRDNTGGERRERGEVRRVDRQPRELLAG